MLTTDERLAVLELINLHGHLTDRGDLAGLSAVFTEDVEYDLTAFGGGVLTGLDAVRAAALALGDRNPVAHHVTNTVLAEDPDGTVRARSKYLGVMADGSVGSGTYDDTVRRLPPGWRISHRRVRPAARATT